MIPEVWTYITQWSRYQHPAENLQKKEEMIKELKCISLEERDFFFFNQTWYNFFFVILFIP